MKKIRSNSLRNYRKEQKIRNGESNTQKSKRSIKHPEAEQRKHSESEDKTNKNRDKSTEENGIEKEKKK